MGNNDIVAAGDHVELTLANNSHQEFDHDDKCDDDQKPQPQKPGWLNFLSFVGPGFLVSLAYLDPGNLETDMQAGANHGYELLWVILIGLIFALIIQSLAANLGVTTGNHLAELCKAEYPVFVKYCLWLLAEVSVIAADIPEGMTTVKFVNNDTYTPSLPHSAIPPLTCEGMTLIAAEVIGTASALHILFHIPLWVGVLMTGFSTLLLLGVQRYGARKLEMVVTFMVFVMAACFFGEVSYVKPPAAGVLKGMFIPLLSGPSATGDAIALLGALIMPHNLFLHSALVLSRKIPNSVRGINDACRFFLIESGIALFVAFLINVAIVAVSAAVCQAENITPENLQNCNNINLNSASFLLKNVLGRSSSTIYAIALLASGQSSTITGTYAGQYIMQGFLDLKMRRWLRNLLTRCVAITPSLIVSIIGGPSAAGGLIIISSKILSFQLPFALIPLLKFSSSSTKMGPHKNSIYIIVISWILGIGLMGINIYYLFTSFFSWMIHSSLPKVATIFIGILVIPAMAIYVIAIMYLVFRKDTVVTFIPRKLENGDANAGEAPEIDRVPFREYLAEIPVPE